MQQSRGADRAKNQHVMSQAGAYKGLLGVFPGQAVPARVSTALQWLQ